MKNKLFEFIDRNQDGYITVKELQEFKAVKSEIDIKNILSSIDLDKNGAINYSEFIAATMNELITKDAKRIHSAFKYFDKDNNGLIDYHDLKSILESESNIPVDDSVIEDVFKEWDYNDDGKIDIKEFYRCMSLKTT